MTNYSIKKKYYPRYPWSLQRKLQFTLLDFLKDIFDLDQNAIDVAFENTNYLSYIGFNKSNSKCLDVSGSPDYKQNIISDLINVPHFKYLFCLNYMVLAENPKKTIQNMYSIIKDDGLAIIGFGSLNYWVANKELIGWNSFTPATIKALTDKFFSETLIIPIGNIYQASINYYCKKFSVKSPFLGEIY